MSCCEPSPEYAAKEAERIKQDEIMMNTDVEVNGVKLKLKDMFSDAWGARDFYTKLNLLNKSKGGKVLMDTTVSSIMDDDESTT